MQEITGLDVYLLEYYCNYIRLVFSYLCVVIFKVVLRKISQLYWSFEVPLSKS